MLKVKKERIRINYDPRISVNPLCEYVVGASAARRNSIIKQCKKPVAFVTKYYNKAENLLSFYLSHVKDDPKFLLIEAKRLVSTPTLDKMEKKYNEASASSLISFMKRDDSVRSILESFSIEMAVHDIKHKFILNGVQISLRPELILRDLSGKQQVGFVKFYFSKNDPLTSERGKLMSALTKYYFEQEFGFNFKNEHCLVLDVFQGKIYTSSKAYKRSISNVKAACLEIFDRWNIVLVD